MSGKATAKVTSQHGICYSKLERTFDEERVRLYADAQKTGLRSIRELARQHGFHADIETRPGFVYSRERKHVEEIENEVEVARRLAPALLRTRVFRLKYSPRCAGTTGDCPCHGSRFTLAGEVLNGPAAPLEQWPST